MPHLDDVVVREITGAPSTVHLLGTIASPDQFQCRDRDEAVSRALAFAQHQHIEAWFQTLDGNLVSLATFRKPRRAEYLRPAKQHRIEGLTGVSGGPLAGRRPRG